MAEPTKTTAPKALEPPPRTTGKAESDLPLLIDWFWRAYQVITQSVKYIQDRVDPTLDVVASLPDPNGTTLAQAQSTANAAYTRAIKMDGWFYGTSTISGANIGVTITFGTPQPDTNYRILAQVISKSGSPSVDAMTVVGISYTTGSFDITIGATPGGGNSVTVQWQLIRI